MNIEKPLTRLMKERANAAYHYLQLRYPQWATKEEIGEAIGVTHERNVRDVLNTLRKKVPVLSNSATKGYRLALRLSDLEEVEHTWKEIDSRIQELEEVKEPLIRFYEKAKTMRRN